MPDVAERTTERLKPRPARARQRSEHTRAMSFSRKYPRAWRAMVKVLGRDEAVRLAQLTRNEAMTRLRVEHRWSLQAIGDLFDLSRERVRQLTPPIEGNGSTPVLSGNGKPSDPEVMREELERVFRRAAHTPSAWDGRGQVSKSWVIDRLGYEPDLPELDFRSPDGSKAEFILRYGLGLEDEADMRAWVERMYFERHMTYDEIARWLSKRFVPIAAMTVHRVITDVLDIKGYGRGQRTDR